MIPCNHNQKKVTLTPETIHYAREDCADCGKFLRWLKHPETIARELEEAKQREALWKVPNLPEWEKGFLLSLDKQGGKMSPKQRSVFERIWNQYGKQPLHPAADC